MKEKCKRSSGITLIALVVTIVVLIILAVISVNLLLNGNIIGRAEQSKEIYQVAQIREELNLVLADAGAEKVLNKEYNENEFLDEFILKQEPDVEILDNIIIKDGHAFELDRSVPKLGEYVGKKEELAIPELEVTTVVADDCKTATITINAKEEENGISKIEIIQVGFVIKEYLYDNEKGPITESFVAKQNGKYIVKVYSKLNVSKVTEVVGLVATIQYSPNGDETYKKAHSVKVTAEDSADKVKNIKYQWMQTTAEPEVNTFVESCNNGDTITKDGLTGVWYLWTLIETESGKSNIGRSEAFYFDNEGPTVRVTATPLTEKSFKLTATAIDTEIGEVSKYTFYVNGELKDTLDYKEEGTELEITLPGAAANVECKVIGYDSLGNPKETIVSARTKLYTWSKWDVKSEVETEWIEEKGRTRDIISSHENGSWHPKGSWNGKEVIIQLIGEPTRSSPLEGWWQYKSNYNVGGIKQYAEHCLSLKRIEDTYVGGSYYSTELMTYDLYTERIKSEIFSKGDRQLGNVQSTHEDEFPNNRRKEKILVYL